MATPKNVPTSADVGSYLASIDPAKRRDCVALVELMQRLTGEPPKMWGDEMVGFGSLNNATESSRAGDGFLCGFASRKRHLAIYTVAGFEDFPEIMAGLGDVETGRSCIKLRSLDDIDATALEELLRASIDALRQRGTQ